jgi:glycosyltransferase involved in cell wall biosynthesis
MVRLKIAIAGTRGIPARYGGFETFAEELSARLVERGHEVWVYCRAGNRESGVGSRSVSASSPTPDTRHPTPVHRIVLPAFRHKYFETVSHTLVSSLDALRRDFDVVLLCNAANAFVLPLLRAARIPVAINVDGIERHRRKWNVAGKLVYAIGESFSALFADKVVADANVIADYYRSRYGIEPVTIPYGAEFPSEEESDVLARLGVEAGNYILYVSRFEPENNPLEVVTAYEGVGNAPKLIMLGAASYARDLEETLRSHTSDRILFPGALYGRDYRTLQRNALIYIQATEVGGTHPAMIEAMASGGCVLAHDTPENREVGEDAVGYFRLRPSETLSGTLRECLESPALRERMRFAARARAGERYSWSAVTDAYERLFEQIVRH